MHIRESTLLVTEFDHGNLSVLGSHGMVGGLSGGCFASNLDIALQGVVRGTGGRGTGRSRQRVVVDSRDRMGRRTVGVIATAADIDANILARSAELIAGILTGSAGLARRRRRRRDAES
jgi:hypothetical protein